MAYTYQELEGLIQMAEQSGDQDLVRELTSFAAQQMIEQPKVETTGFAKTALQGLTLGLADEIAGSIAGQEAQRRARQEVQAFREARPGMAMLAEGLGGLGAGAGLGMLLPRAGRLGQTLARPTIGSQAAAGAAEGAISGFAQGETLGERVRGALTGAALGGAIGAPGGYLAQAITRRLQPGMHAERQLERSLGQGLGRTPTAQDYARMAEQAQAQPQMTLAEIGGPVTESLARTIHSVPGQARQVAEQVLENRRRSMIPRIMDKLAETTGTRAGYWSTLENLSEEASSAAGPLYRQAYEYVVDPTPELVDLIQRGVKTGDLQKGYSAARRIAMRAEGLELPPLNKVIGKEGEIIDLSPRTLDWMKRGLDARYKQMASATPGEIPSFQQYRKEFVRELDEAIPGYREARQAYAGPMAQREAAEAGAKIFKEDPEYTAAYIADMSQGEKDAYIIGAANAIKERLKNIPPEGGMPKINQGMLEKMEAAFPTREAYEQFRDAILTERGMQRFRNIVMSRSPTADILMGQRQAAGDIATAMGELATGNLRSAASIAAQRLIPGTPTEIPEYISEPLSRMLFAQGEGVLGALQSLQRPPVMPRLLTPAITGGLVGTTGTMRERR